MSNKYSPGQRLNTAAEVMQALLDGETLEQDGCPFLLNSHGDVQRPDGLVVTLIVQADTKIYSPPKRKIVSTRWFAVLPLDVGFSDKLVWVSADSEEQARRREPNALAYVKAEVEVEVPSDD